MSAVDWVVRESAVPRATVDDLIARRRRTVELRYADALVAALNVPQAWHDGTLEIIPNERAVDRGAGCVSCGGSLTGAA